MKNVMASLGSLGGTKFVAIALAGGIAISGTMVWSASTAAFTNYTTNPSNAWTTGTVSLTDDDGGTSPTTGTALFTQTLVTEASTGEKCIKVTSNTNVDSGANVKLYTIAGYTDVDDLDDHLHLTIEIDDGSTSSGTNGDCTGFTATGGPIFDNDLSTMGTTYAGGYEGAAWNPTTASTYRVYKITWNIDDDIPDADQGKTITGVAFRWAKSA